MRTTTVLATLLAISLILFLGGWFRPQPKTTPAASPDPVIAAPAPPVAVAAAPPESVAVAVPDTDDQVQEDIERQIAELAMLARNDDTLSLERILLFLNDPDPEIRATALEAAIQFGSPDAIPALQLAGAKTDTPAEKMKLQEAVEFLALPPLVVNVSTNAP